jgi:putative spermidine/putrescine transport system permease protein
MVGVLKDIDPTLTEAAIDLGATPIRSFFEVTLPLAKSGILSGTLLAFIVSFNEFTISYFIMSYRTVTLPIIIWTSLRYGVSPTVAAVSVIMLIIVAISLGAIAKLVGIEKISIK